jgi:hypothetical protein
MPPRHLCGVADYPATGPEPRRFRTDNTELCRLAGNSIRLHLISGTDELWELRNNGIDAPRPRSLGKHHVRAAYRRCTRTFQRLPVIILSETRYELFLASHERGPALIQEAPQSSAAAPRNVPLANGYSRPALPRSTNRRSHGVSPDRHPHHATTC